MSNFRWIFNFELQLPACFAAVVSYNELLAIRKMGKDAGEQMFLAV